MSDLSNDIPDAPADASVLEKADVAVAKAVAPLSRTPVMRVLGVLSDVSDQPPTRILCAGVIGWGLYRGDTRLMRAGVRMIAAHSVATGMKTLIKHRIDRTRPTLLIEEGRYEMAPGQSREHDESSFPSGHTAGAVAVAAAVAHDYPEAGPAAYAVAAVVAALQIPRCTHYASDVAAGAVVGLAAAAAVNTAGDAAAHYLERVIEQERAAPTLSSPDVGGGTSCERGGLSVLPEEGNGSPLFVNIFGNATTIPVPVLWPDGKMETFT